MNHELELTKTNRLKIARAFHHNRRVDYSIDCAIEGQLGRVFVDDPSEPAVYCLRVGPFGYFAGEASSATARELMASFPAYHLLMPSPAAWLELAREIFGADLVALPRYSFSSAQLSAARLSQLLARSRYRDRVTPISFELARQAFEQPESYLDLSDFDSAEDFVERGFGYTILDAGKTMGVAYSSLVCSQGIEVSVFVEDIWRGRGVATALCSQLLLSCLRYGLRPNWDAANQESVRLAEKLGYLYLESYNAYYHTNSRATS
jgi:GNAT superfamily N-acetyltransferase